MRDNKVLEVFKKKVEKKFKEMNIAFFTIIFLNK